MYDKMVKIDLFKNKEYAYLYSTEFLVQIKHINSSIYKTQFRSLGDMKPAIKAYNNILPIKDHKKRIIMVGNLGETVIDVENFK